MIAAHARKRPCLLPAPTLSECGHRGLAGCRVAMPGRAILMMSKGKRPQPRTSYRRRVGLHDAANDDALGEHVVVVIVPVAGGTRGRGGLKDQIVLLHR